jgi:hypothetical protein
MAPNLTKERTDGIRFAIMSATVKHPNLYAIADAWGCSYESVRYHRDNILLEMASAGNRPLRRPGPAPAYDEAIMYFTSQLLDRDNELYQDEVVDEIFDAFDVRLSQSQMSRMYKEMKLSNKKIDYVAFQQDLELM